MNPLTILYPIAAVLLVATAVVSAEPAAAPVTAGPAPAAKIVAEADVYYLIQRVKVTTDSGIVGVPIGTKIKVIEKAPGGLKATTPDKLTIVVTKAQITQDAAKAQALASGDAATQLAIQNQNSIAAKSQADTSAADAQAAQQRAAQAAATAQTGATPAPAPGASPGAPLGSSMDAATQTDTVVKPFHWKKKKR